MKSKVPKQYIEILGLPILTRTLKNFISCEIIDQTIVVVSEKDREFCIKNIIKPNNFTTKVDIISGGIERQESVINGLDKIKKNAKSLDKTIVLIHDGVRPFADHDMINRCIEGAIKHGACIPGIPIQDTVKKIDAQGFIHNTINRNNLYQIQTPQAFKLKLILEAYEYAGKHSFSGTDDAFFLEKIGGEISITKGSKKNIKITNRDDLKLASFLCKA
ncbi:MAG: 2-C-methyl-D-erythritol 4-phosphate cytidylyltransferase [Desulfobacteraceae bacterium 4572_130]|nr:MAG: 2-C-methyl-D-erythritol 4-phosphate cytidylyltransferase [Desulfobacteraceae bacterium 4572_130]